MSPVSRQPALTTVNALLAEGLARPDQADDLRAVSDSFRLRLSSEMRNALRDRDDPIARQFVPTPAELVTRPEERADPIGDQTHKVAPGLTHRYPDRVILAVTQSCDVYCRFCFRRETVGADGALSDADLDAACAYIAAHPAIWEVVLTGGDPLSLSARRVGAILDRLSRIPHLGIIRFHTRVPVVSPERITPALIRALKVRQAVYIVIHTNHAQELTEAARAALARLADAGIPLLSQTVLLKGINDNADTLENLFRTLLRHRVKPYYLHHCDLARGTSHFRTTIAEGQAIMESLRGRLSGAALPTYVLDIPGGFGKVPIGPAYLTPEAGGWRVTDPRGRSHLYHDPD
ncbi:MAG: lysine-2,3-aminomutase-like protein [Rhodobacteraceae bacterium]|nr:lysine-2,3-aminomutase-like protein [Paracoccaceae bacterium]